MLTLFIAAFHTNIAVAEVQLKWPLVVSMYYNVLDCLKSIWMNNSVIFIVNVANLILIYCFYDHLWILAVRINFPTRLYCFHLLVCYWNALSQLQNIVLNVIFECVLWLFRWIVQGLLSMIFLAWLIEFPPVMLLPCKPHPLLWFLLNIFK